MDKLPTIYKYRIHPDLIIRWRRWAGKEDYYEFLRIREERLRKEEEDEVRRLDSNQRSVG